MEIDDALHGEKTWSSARFLEKCGKLRSLEVTSVMLKDLKNQLGTNSHRPQGCLRLGDSRCGEERSVAYVNRNGEGIGRGHGHSPYAPKKLQIWEALRGTPLYALSVGAMIIPTSLLEVLGKVLGDP
jgi:hypothetical protein